MSKWVIDRDAADEFADPAWLDDVWAVAIKKFGGRPLDGNASDGHHAFQELYDQRAALLMATCNSIMAYCHAVGVEYGDAARFLFKSRAHHDGETVEGYFVAGINCQRLESDAEGRWATWHVEDKWWDKFAIPALERAPEWDGHTPQEALERLVTSFAPIGG